MPVSSRKDSQFCLSMKPYSLYEIETSLFNGEDMALEFFYDIIYMG